jgi:hypothetical protein
MIDPLLSLALSAGFALLLAAAAWHKVASHASFVEALEGYRLLPAALLQPAGWILPAVEAGLAVAWLAGSGQVAAAGTSALLVVYGGAIAINLARGRVHIACGCGLGASADVRLSGWLVARNVLLAAVAGGAALPVAERALTAYDWLTLLAACATALLLYAASSQLLQNGAAIASWRSDRD